MHDICKQSNRETSVEPAVICQSSGQQVEIESSCPRFRKVGSRDPTLPSLPVLNSNGEVLSSGNSFPILGSIGGRGTCPITLFSDENRATNRETLVPPRNRPVTYDRFVEFLHRRKRKRFDKDFYAFKGAEKNTERADLCETERLFNNWRWW